MLSESKLPLLFDTFLFFCACEHGFVLCQASTLRFLQLTHYRQQTVYAYVFLLGLLLDVCDQMQYFISNLTDDRIKCRMHFCKCHKGQGKKRGWIQDWSYFSFLKNRKQLCTKPNDFFNLIFAIFDIKNIFKILSLKLFHSFFYLDNNSPSSFLLFSFFPSVLLFFFFNLLV